MTITSIMIALILLFAAVIIVSILKKLIKLAITIFLIAVIFFALVGGLRYYNFTNNFNELDTIILARQDGRYLQGLEGMEVIENLEVLEKKSKEELLEGHDMLIIINEEINLGEMIEKSSRENLNLIIALEKQGKAEVMPQGIMYKIYSKTH